MRITLINQTFYPDVASSGQHLTDLALRLVERGHQVSVVTSRRAYDAPEKVFPKREDWRGIRIYRLWNSGFGKRAKWTRAVDFATFLASCCWRLALLPRQDLLLAMTSPPLVSFIAACFARLRSSKFCYWIMDLNPDEALAAGWLAPNSFAARSLEALSRFSLRHASAVVVLDRFMQDRILAKGIPAGKIAVIPPWSHDSEVKFDPEGRARFRKTHGLEEKFVVMYSGNHSPCHPLETVLAGVKRLSANDEIAFCFVGGGSEFARVKKMAQQENLPNVVCLPYQPLAQLAGALSAADLHLVVMGDPFVGVVHPCKAYNVLRVGAPLLYVGPKPSHISEMLGEMNRHGPCRLVSHGETERFIESVLELKKSTAGLQRQASGELAERFSERSLLPQLVEVLESASGREPALAHALN